MVDFNPLKGVNLSPNLSGIRAANAASTSGPSHTPGRTDSFERTSLFAGEGLSHGVDFNAIANMSLDDARAALPGSFDGLRFLASV